MKTNPLFPFLQKVNEKRVVKHGENEPANVYIEDAPAFNEDEELFAYCLEQQFIKPVPFSEPWPWWPSSKTYRLTETGEEELSKLDPSPKWLRLGSILFFD